jgi:competence protein ComEA
MGSRVHLYQLSTGEGKMKKFLASLSVLVFFCTMAGPVWGEEAEMININTASTKELEQLDMIGPGKAVKIVEYREINGPFERPEDIMKVAGIGSKTFERNKDRITVKLPE